MTPIAGESLDGLLNRFAAANYIDNISRLLKTNVPYASCRGTDTASTAKLYRIAAMMGVVPTELLSRAYHPVAGVEAVRNFFGVTIHRTDLDREHRRFAPASLAISPHHRALWQLRAFPFCIESWEYLTDACGDPRCAKRQHWNRSLGPDRCNHCLGVLSRQSGEVVADNLRARLEAAVDVVHPDAVKRRNAVAMLPDAVASLGSSGIFELLARLIPVTDPTLPHGRDADVWRIEPVRLAQGMADAWDLAVGWPASIIGLMHDRIRTAGHRYSDGNRGATMRFLRLAVDKHTPTPVAALIGDLRRSLDVDHQDNDALRATVIDCGSTNLALGRKALVLVDMRRRGVLNSIFTHRRGKPVAMFDAAEIREIRAEMEDRATVPGAGALLGMPNYGVEQLAALGLLATFERPYMIERYGPDRLVMSSVKRLLALFTDAAVKESGKTIPLNFAVNAIGGRLKPWGAIIASLIGRGGPTTIPFSLEIGDAPLAKRVRVLATDIARLSALTFDYARPSPIGYSTLISKQDAGEVLNLGPTETVAFMRECFGFAATYKPAMPLDKIVELAIVHVSHGELAIRAGMPHQAVNRVMRSVGVAKAGVAGFPRIAAEAALPSLAEDAIAAASHVRWKQVADLSGLKVKRITRAMAKLGYKPFGKHGWPAEAVEAALPTLRLHAAELASLSNLNRTKTGRATNKVRHKRL